MRAAHNTTTYSSKYYDLTAHCVNRLSPITAKNRQLDVI